MAESGFGASRGSNQSNRTFIVEMCKRSLTQDPVIQSSVDWLTEVIRRFSEAALAAKSLSLVNMQSPMRKEMVG